MRTKTISVITLAVILSGLPSCSADRETSSRAEDENVIRRISLDRIERFNKNHEPPLESEFTADADFVNVYGMWRKGATEIEARQKERMQTVLKDAKITLLDLQIRFVRPDVAIVHQTHQMSGMLGSDGVTMPPHQERGVRVFVKERGMWLTTAFHNTIVRDPELRDQAKQ